MAERYDHFGEAGGPHDDCPYGWISEWLCEYVDGTMDPSMQAVFEEYMEANPELAAHVESLCRTRALLGECGCRQEAAERAKARLQQVSEGEYWTDEEKQVRHQIEAQIEETLAEGGDLDTLTAPLSAGTVVAVASAMTLMLGVGMVAGAVLFTDPAAQKPAAQAAAVEQATAGQADPAPDRTAIPPARAFGAVVGHTSDVSPWSAPPFPLRKMPMSAGDSVHSTMSSPLVQRTGLNP